MSRNHQPLTDDEIAELRGKMDAQRTDIRAALAEDLDSDPDDYRADCPVTDGGE
mgnify:CR=1 FL=1|jgi:hypothetical protein